MQTRPNWEVSGTLGAGLIYPDFGVRSAEVAVAPESWCLRGLKVHLPCNKTPVM